MSDGHPRLGTGTGSQESVGVLFVCTANICRSPIAEGVFRVAAERARLIQRLHVDSAGTHGGHAGASPDPRATKTALARGYSISQLRARQVEPRDFERFAWIFAMDRENLHILSELCPPAFSGTLGLYLDLVPEIGLREVPDPYYGALEGFERVIDLAEAASEALVLRLSRELRG